MMEGCVDTLKFCNLEINKIVLLLLNCTKKASPLCSLPLHKNSTFLGMIHMPAQSNGIQYIQQGQMAPTTMPMPQYNGGKAFFNFDF